MFNYSYVQVKNWYTWFTTPLPGTAVFPKNILDSPDEKEDVYRAHLPHSNLGSDKEGHPIYWEKTGFSKKLLI